MDETSNQFPSISPPPLPEAPIKSSKAPKPVLKIILGVVVVLAVLGGVFTAVLATRAWDPLWNPFRPKPEEILSKAISNIDAVKIVHADANFSLNVKDAMPGENDTFVFKTASDLDNSDLKNLKQQSVLDVSASVSGGLAVTVEVRGIGDDVYFNLEKIDSELLSSFLTATAGVDINQFKDVWIKIDEQSLAGLTGAAPQIANNQQLGEKIQQIFLSNKLFSVKNELPDEKVGGVLTYHYVLALDNATVVKAFSDAMLLITQGQLKSNNELTAYATAEFESILGKILESIGEININIWIGKKDNLPYKISLEKTIPLANIVKALYGGTDLGLPNTGAITLKMDESFSKFNEPIQIKAPENFRNFSDLLAPLMANYQFKSKDASISDNLLQIQSAADSIYQSSKSYYGLTCKNATVKPFCEEIKNIAGAYPTIRVSKTKYCAYSKLVTPENYFCIANQGYYENAGVNPSSRGYCAGTTFVCPNNPVLPAGY